MWLGILTNGVFWLVEPFEFWVFVNEPAINLAFVHCKIIDFVDMQEIAFLVSMATEVAYGDMVGADHSFFLGHWVHGSKDVICDLRLSGAISLMRLLVFISFTFSCCISKVLVL
jgi:hypothetical protein